MADEAAWEMGRWLLVAIVIVVLIGIMTLLYLFFKGTLWPKVLGGFG